MLTPQLDDGWVVRHRGKQLAQQPSSSSSTSRPPRSHTLSKLTARRWRAALRRTFRRRPGRWQGAGALCGRADPGEHLPV
eukprot:2186240-Prymnesium_polylepis.1